MPELIKCPEYNEIFIIEDGKKSWIENWDTFVYLAETMGLTWNQLLAELQIIQFEKLRDNYPVGPTKVKMTITTIVEGKKPREIFYPEKPPITIRKMAILGTCLPNTPIEHMKNLGFTHFYGNRTWWPDHNEVKRHGLKVFYNIRTDDEMTEAYVKKEVQQYKDRKFIGGWWSDQLGHEPDIVNQPLEKRKWFYQTVRKYDPDKQHHPVMEMFDMTEKFNDYPGWKDAFSDETHDLLLFDCYPSLQMPNDAMIKEMESVAWIPLVSKYPHIHQVIPQMLACGSYRKGSIWCQYNYWKEKMASAEFDNPYRGQIGVCFYKDECVRQNSEMQQEIKEVIADAMK